MTVYGEYLFIENMAAGIFIGYFTGKILHIRPGLVRLLICGILCGAYSFSMFWPKKWAFEIGLRLVFGVVISRLLFKKQSHIFHLKGGCLFIGLTVLYSGLVLALMQLTRSRGMVSGEGMYLGFDSYTYLLAISLAGALMVKLLINMLNEKRREQSFFTSVTLYVNDKTIEAQGFMDSGNFLREPITGKPVVMASNRCVERIKKLTEIKAEQFVIIPYKSIGKEGILEGFRINKLVAEGKTLYNPVLALCGEDYFDAGEVRKELILPSKIMEGE